MQLTQPSTAAMLSGVVIHAAYTTGCGWLSQLHIQQIFLTFGFVLIREMLQPFQGVNANVLILMNYILMPLKAALLQYADM